MFSIRPPDARRPAGPPPDSGRRGALRVARIPVTTRAAASGGGTAGRAASPAAVAVASLVAGLLALAGPMGRPAAAEPPPRPSEVIAAELLPGWRTASGTHMAALHLTLAENWKTYWRSPGEAGIPPEFDWSASRNLTGAALHWPRPHVFRLNGTRTLGYRHDLVLPIEITPRDAGRDITVDAVLDLGVCRDICMPVQLRIVGTLPATAGAGAGGQDGHGLDRGPARGTAAAGGHELPASAGGRDPRIEAALADAPRPGRAAGLAGLHCRVEPIADGLRVTARMELPSQGKGEMAVIETQDPTVWVSEAIARREGRTLSASADLVPPGAGPFPLDRSGLRITVLGDGGAVDIRGCPGG